MGFYESPVKDAGTTAKNSTSLRRAPGPKDEATKGSTTNYPFWPGGFGEDLDEELHKVEEVKEGKDDNDVVKATLNELEDESR